MELQSPVKTDWSELTQTLGRAFSARAEKHDREGSFVFENYQELKQHEFFSAAIPEELGGGGVSHTDMCEMIRVLGQSCGSTALAFAMHQHLVAAAVWKYLNKGESAPLLQKVVKDQVVLVSTGAKDWLESNGEVTRADGGYLVSARKHFASQSIIGDMVVTSSPFLHPEEGWKILHFAVPMTAEGVSVLDDWKVLGMRGTGSQTIVFEQVFVPDSAVSLIRPRTGYHSVWDVVLTVAMPLIMSAYVGIAENAFKVAIGHVKHYQPNAGHKYDGIGKMKNTLVSTQTQWRAMSKLTDNHRFKPSQAITINMLSLKTNVAEACIQTVHEAMEVVGGQSFYKGNLLERLFRDVQAAQFHPLPKWEQYAFTGKYLLDVDEPLPN